MRISCFHTGVVLACLLLVAGTATAGSALAQSDDLAALNQRISELYSAGKYGEAIPLAEKSLELTRSLKGQDHLDVATSLNNLAELYRNQGRYGEAEPLCQSALALYAKVLGTDHPFVAAPLNNLAALYQTQGHYAQAEPLYKRALAISEKALGPDHPDVGTSLNNLAVLYQTQGHYAQAEPVYKRQLSIFEKALGPDHSHVGTALTNLAELYFKQGRIDEAEPLMTRALAIAEKALGPDHPDVATSLNNLAVLYESQGRVAEAEPLMWRALAIREKALGPDHSDVGQSINNLAELYRNQGVTTETEPLYKRALALREKVLGPDHPDVGQSINNLALLYTSQDRYAEAEPLLKSSVALFERALGPDHPDVATSLNNLAFLFFVQRDWPHAADYWRRSTGVIVRRAGRGTDDVGQALTGKRKSESEDSGHSFRGLVKTVYRLAAEGGGSDAGLGREMFQTAQWASTSEAARSLAQMAARTATGDPGLSRLVRGRQDLVEEWQKRDQARSAAASQAQDKRDRAAETVNVARIAAIDMKIVEIDKQLAVDFPDYAALVNPGAVPVEDIQAQLGTGEALLLFFDTLEWKPTPEESFLWVVTKTDMRWVRVELGTKALTERVAALRCGLDHTLWDPDGAQSCKAALRAVPGVETVKVADKDQDVQVLPFDVGRAHDLYKALLGPVEDLIKGKHLLIVPSGPLTSLPFNVLVTEQPRVGNAPSKLSEYRTTAWLGTRQPITVLPSVTSLKALRQFAKTSHATKAYLGVGNPLLDGQQDDPQNGAYYKTLAQAARDKQQCPKTMSQRIALAAARPLTSFAKLFRGGSADIEEVRQWTPLPETADELCEVGRRLGVAESEILLGSRATETALKDLSEKGKLNDYAILHFATHGALTGQMQGSAEPGLILTPPPNGTTDLERDDGFLTASEIATLKLDADWVILSACNTAGSSGETAEALSGMARAFFYAGARALLVSHWEVSSDAAVKLTTRAFARLKANPKIGRAEAFRLSMRELIEKGSPAEAHPSQWAPFVVVGEGAAVR